MKSLEAVARRIWERRRLVWALSLTAGATLVTVFLLGMALHTPARNEVILTIIGIAMTVLVPMLMCPLITLRLAEHFLSERRAHFRGVTLARYLPRLLQNVWLGMGILFNCAFLLFAGILWPLWGAFMVLT